jgi:serine/threonine protein kinase
MDVMPHPTTVGKYRLLHEIGKGSMGRVYLGHDALIERDVAVKIALPERLACPRTGEDYERLFFREARTAGRLTHEDIAAVFDAGIDHGLPYIVLEYVAGGRDPRRFLCARQAIADRGGHQGHTQVRHGARLRP